jgi:hypothetical protein
MDDRHVMRLIKAAERIATATEQIAETLAAMHAADPMAMIQKAVAAEAGKEPAADPPNTPVPYGADLPESERWRLGS